MNNGYWNPVEDIHLIFVFFLLFSEHPVVELRLNINIFIRNEIFKKCDFK